MRAATGLVALCVNLAIACTASHAPLDAGTDSGTAREDAGVLEPCSPAVFSDYRHFLTLPHLCRDPLASAWELGPDGLPWVTADAFAPIALTSTDRGIVLEGLLAHRFERGNSPESPLIAAAVRYRIRLDDPAPFAALEEALPIAPEVAVAEFFATREETDCESPGHRGSGRLLCASVGRWDVWTHAARVDYDLPGLISAYRPSLPAIALVDRVGRRTWWLRLQGLPTACEHEAGTVPTEPCQPELAPGAAWVMFVVEDDGSGPGTACPLQLTCVPCCRPADAPYECWEPRGFHRCDENAAWLDDACEATRLDDLVPPPSPPCLPDWEFAFSPCGGSNLDTDCF